MEMMMKAPRWLREPVEANTIDDVMQLIDEVSWHDSVVYSITCIRKESLDAVVINTRLLYDWDKQLSCPVRITFGGCLRVSMEMDWGVECLSDGEMIAGLEIAAADDVIDAVRNIRQSRDLGSIYHITLTLASTGSRVDIAGTGLRIEPIGSPNKHSAPPPLFSASNLPGR
jgi:hypothetical protein